MASYYDFHGGDDDDVDLDFDESMPLCSRFQGIVFDKDGTLLDFAATWDPAIFAAIRKAAVGDLARQQAIADELGYDLSARSFVVQPKDGAALLFHAENKDICSLVVDGLQMLMKDHKRRLKKSATKKSHGKKTLGAPPAAKKAPLGNAANVAH